MKLCFSLLASALLCVSASAQCVTAPDFQNFDAATTGVPGIYPTGWIDGGGTRSFDVRTGTTTSTATGPSADRGGSGNYIYCETSSPVIAGDTFIIETPCYDTTGLTTPTFEYYVHAFGVAIGPLSVEQSDGVGGWTVIDTVPGEIGDLWSFRSAPFTPIAGEARFRFVYTAFQPPVGSVFSGDLALDDVTVGNGSIMEWQTNSPGLSIDFNGAQADPLTPARTLLTANACPSGIDPALGTFSLEMAFAGGFYDIAVSPFASEGAITGSGTPLIGSTDLVNINVAQPFVFLSTGGLTSVPFALPGAGIPGATGPLGYSVPLSFSAATRLTLQAYGTDPTSPTGVTLSQAADLEVVVATAVNPQPGPNASSFTNLTLDITTGANCYTTAGMPFYGTLYTTIYVSPNGFIAFGGGGDTDTTPSVLDILNDDGRVGFWSNLDPTEGGSITVTSPAVDMIQIDWVAVEYDLNNAGGANTFSILLDATNGSITLSGLTGIVANTTGTATTDDQMLCMSPGLTGPATDPGPAGFGLGLAGIGAGTDALYEFLDTSVALTGLLPSIAGGMDVLQFVPNGNGNYDWVGL